MADDEALEPPKAVSPDPGARQLTESSDSEDQFTDAQSAPTSPKGSPSQIPKTRVEKVDGSPSYGQVPGTEAYKIREEDAAPDEIAVAHPGQGSSSPSSAATSTSDVPATVVEEAPGGTPRPHSAEFQDRRKADAAPDLVLNSDGEARSGEDEGDGTSDTRIPPAAVASPNVGRARSKSSRSVHSTSSAAQGVEHGGDGDDGFADDFDDFEDGAGADDDDFDDFEDGFQQAPPSASPTPAAPFQQTTLPFPIPDFDGLSPDDVMSATDPYLASLFPPDELDLEPLPPLSKDSFVFLTPRSASLWSQLVAPPPLAPPDWIRSRTRRLFLVSLGVPVDLDEILPASKQKKLVLPSLNVPPSRSPRTSDDSRSASRLRASNNSGNNNNGGGDNPNASSTSVDTQGKPKRRRGPPPPPELDLVAARLLCQTTDEALDGMTNAELKAHVDALQAMQGTARELLEHWQKRADEKIGDREAFEGVIENLVKHARKTRK